MRKFVLGSLLVMVFTLLWVFNPLIRAYAYQLSVEWVIGLSLMISCAIWGAISVIFEKPEGGK